MKDFFFIDKKITIFLVFYFVLLLFLINIPDPITDEIAFYYRFNIGNLNEWNFKELTDFLFKTDHFPVYFFFHGVIYHLFKNVISLRIISIIYSLISIVFLINILKLKKKKNIFIYLFVFLWAICPVNLYITIFSSKYNIALMFLIITFYFYQRTFVYSEKKNYVYFYIFFLISALTHYFNLFFGFLFLQRILKKRMKIFINLIFFLVFIYMIFNFNNIFSKFDLSGENSLISINSVIYSDLRLSFMNFINILGGAFLMPFLYVPKTLYYYFNFLGGIFLIINVMIKIYKQKKIDIFWYTLAFPIILAFISLIAEYRWNVIFIETSRLVFIFPFFIYLLVDNILKFGKKIMLSFCIFLFISGIYNICIYTNDDISNIYKIIRENNIKEIYSDSGVFKDRFQESFLLLDKTSNLNIKDFNRKSINTSFYLFTNYILEDQLPEYNSYEYKKVYEGFRFNFYLFEPNIKAIK